MRASPRIVFFAYASAITLMPALMLLYTYGADAAYTLLTGDAFLYLGIGLSSTADVFSFDGEAATNGFHPVWQFYVWGLAQLLGDFPVVFMNVVAWSSVLLVEVGVLLLGVAIHRATNSWWLGLLATPGLYFALIGQGFGNLAVWDFFTGMEAGLVFAITGWIAYLAAGLRPDTRQPGTWMWLGLALALLVMTRLDEVFVPLCIGLFYLVWSPRDILRRIPVVAMLWGPTGIALLLYWSYNLSYMGFLMPISGMVKGGFELLSNGSFTARVFFSPFDDIRHVLTGHETVREVVRANAFRPVQLLFPALFAAGFVVLVWRRFRDAPWAVVVVGGCAAIVIKAGYNFMAVNYFSQASWYFAFASGFVSFVGALVLAPVARSVRKSLPEVGVVVVCGFLAFSLLHAGRDFIEKADFNGELLTLVKRDFLEEAEDIEAALSVWDPDPKVLEFGDGFLNFALSIPVRHGFVFAGDAASLDGLQREQLLQMSYDAGYRIFASFEYLRWPDATLNMTSDDIRSRLKPSFLDRRVEAELHFFDLSIVHIYEPLGTVFIGFTPKKAGVEISN
ncbi:MAG: hypothetical protein ACI9IV_001052 [Paracoccaceae bacterium]